jgi:glycosyltransferase involved in cell wall biosynthesis
LSQFNEPLISIITVVFNGEKYLEQTIQSVIKQTYKNIEYIIIDGGSTDNTLSIINKYEGFIAKWVSEPDKGLYDAMNKGIKMSNGDLVGMINSDDWYEIDAVEQVVKSFEKNPQKKIFHADRYDVSSEGERIIKKFNPSSLKFKYYGMTYNHPSMFVSNKIYSEIQYNTELVALSDYEFVLNCFLKNSNNFFYIDKPIVNYRLDGISGQMKLSKRLKEGYIARRNSGMGLINNFLSLIVRISVVMIKKIFVKNS